MKILLLSHDPLFPERSGQRLRTLSLFRALSSRHEVVLHVPGGAGDGSPARCPPRSDPRARMVLSWLGGGSAWRARFADPTVVGSIRNLLKEKFDLVVCAGLPSSFCLPPEGTGTPVWLDEQNVEWRILERAAALRGRAMGWLVRAEAERLRKSETESVKSADLVSCCSNEDVATLGRGMVLPNPAGDPPCDHLRVPQAGRIVFTGTLCWGPNVDAARWMAREVFPRVRKADPDAVLRLVGRDPSPEVRALEAIEGVEVVGEVDSVWQELASASLAVAPIRMGSGTRIKILEASIAGTPVVSTRIGAEGLDFVNGSEILLADDPEGFAKACAGLIADPQAAEEMGIKAQRACRKLYGTKAFVERALELAERAVAHRS